MILSMKWLKDFVDIDMDAHKFSEAMTMTGSKVEGFEIEGEEINNVVVGKVLSIDNHPNAEKLVICKVDTGNEPIQIVTGATNLKVGNLVPVALDGSTLPNGVKIKKGKLRGETSEGMMCSLAELNITINDFPYAVEDGIFIIQEECKPGDDIKDVLQLNDTSIEFEITPNRPDCLSVIGIAREAAVTFDTPLKLHTPVVKESSGNIDDMLTVKVSDTDLCSRYMNRIITNVKIAPSPLWIRERLRACGVRPINNIVDITNYVMLEYGQPMHAFDYRYVKGNSIDIRRANDGEKIVTLDGIERNLMQNMLVIANSEGPMAVAGVMGGEFSGIMNDSKTVVFESACFKGSSIRNTSRALSMRTDSSSRFEKGLDAQNCAKALDRACELVEQLGAGKVVRGVIDINNSNYTPTKIELDSDFINSFIGIDLEKEHIQAILTDLGFNVSDDIIEVPSFRGDVQHKADIAEEIARIYGYDQIESTEISGSAAAIITEEQQVERASFNTLIALGYSDIYTFSFISPKYYDKILIPADSEFRKSVKIMNPLGEDTSIMRTTALPSMLEILSKNYASRNMEAKLFEIATEYIPQDENELPLESKKIIIGAYADGFDYYSIKGAVEEIIHQLNISEYDIAKADVPWLHPGRSAVLTIGNTKLGEIGEIHPAVAKNYDLDVKAYVASLDLSVLLKYSNNEKTYHKTPHFPAINRDLALICDIDLPVIVIEKEIKSAAGKLIESIKLFDVYTGNQVENGKKSVAYSIMLRASDRTLTDEDADKTINKILNALSKINVSLRK